MANNSSCEPGFRNDDFVLFETFYPCALSESVQFGLFVTWSCLFMIALVEVGLTSLLHVNNLPLLVRVPYFAWLCSLTCLCLYCAILPMASVATSSIDSTVIWFFWWFAGVTGVFGLIMLQIKLVLSAISSVKTYHHPYMVFVVCEASILVIFTITHTLTLQVLLHSFSTQLDTLVNGSLINFGLAVPLSLICFIALTEYAIRTANKTNSDEAALERIHRLRWNFFFMCTILVPFSILYIITGAVLSLRYEIFHVLIGPGSILIILALMFQKSSLSTRFFLKHRMNGVSITQSNQTLEMSKTPTVVVSEVEPTPSTPVADVSTTVVIGFKPSLSDDGELSQSLASSAGDFLPSRPLSQFSTSNYDDTLPSLNYSLALSGWAPTEGLTPTADWEAGEEDAANEKSSLQRSELSNLTIASGNDGSSQSLLGQEFSSTYIDHAIGFLTDTRKPPSEEDFQLDLRERKFAGENENLSDL